jgi:hypothetical protein
MDGVWLRRLFAEVAVIRVFFYSVVVMYIVYIIYV